MIKIHDISRAEVRHIPLPIKTQSYTPISNSFILDKIDYFAKNVGLVRQNELFRCTKNGSKVIGTLNYEGDDSEMGIKVAFKNSYDKSRSFGIAVGGNVFVCLNGVISGEYTGNRVHTGDAMEATESIIQAAFSKAIVEYNLLKDIKERLKEHIMYRDLMYNIIGELFFDYNVLNTQQLNILQRNIVNGTKDFKCLDSNEMTYWDGYNHITEVLKLSHPNDYINNHIQLHKLFIEELPLANEVS